MDTYGYIRVSAKEQNKDRQIIAMREFGVTDNYIVPDKQSGKNFERPGCRRLGRKKKSGINFSFPLDREASQCYDNCTNTINTVKGSLNKLQGAD